MASLIRNKIAGFLIKENEFFRLEDIDKTIITLMYLLLFLGIFLFYKNNALYRAYVKEDGFIEWLTVIPLWLSADLSIKRFFRLRKKRNFGFLVILIFTSLIFIFGAGEEISWGQRILNIKSPAFFMQYNRQHETNIHNLLIDGVKVNKLVFSLLLGIAIAIYLMIIPLLYQNKKRFKEFIDQHAIPIPRFGHIISFLIFALIIKIYPEHAEKWELLEMATAFTFMIILLNPLNRKIYDSN